MLPLNVLWGPLRYALKRKLVAHNVVHDLDRDDRPGTRRQSERRYLTAAESELLLSKLSDTFKPVMHVRLYGGLRISEALGLRWCDLDLKAETLTIERQLGPRGERVPVRHTRRPRPCGCCRSCAAS
jgi:integrase